MRAREQDDDPDSDPYTYTTFIHLKTIFDKQWSTLSRGLPVSVANDKRLFLDNLQDLNKIRNRIMHPVRRYSPTVGDFQFVLEFALVLFGKAALD